LALQNSVDRNAQTVALGSQQPPSERSQVSAPTLSLPKGGGAIRGIGEKFAANPVTGTGSMSVPIATSPGRAGFGPQLSLSYDSGAGNGPFDFGWNLSLSSITRKTDKGLPHYDGGENQPDSDVFILSGAEDLVSVLTKNTTGEWTPKDEPSPDGKYRIRCYRPHIEGLFARIECWTNVSTGETHWRSISKDNITTLYGKDNNARIFDPADPDPLHPTRIFTWLICESYDDKGNALVYTYKAEDDKGIDIGAAHERNRLTSKNFAQRYLKRIQYGNRTPRQANEDLRQRHDWMFEVVLDYGEHYAADAQGQPTFVDIAGDTRTWPVRADAFSTYRVDFEVHPSRLCRRVLMFHHFPAEGAAGGDEPAVGQNCLGHATEFSHEEARIASYLTEATQASFRRQGAGYVRRAPPPLQFAYSKAEIQAELKTVDTASLENLPYGIDSAHYQFVDLYGEGVSGVLTDQAGAWFYKRNLSPLILKTARENNGCDVAQSEARFAPIEQVALNPAPGNLGGGQQVIDLGGDGQNDLVQFAPPLAGYFSQDTDGEWQPFVPFRGQPNLERKPVCSTRRPPSFICRTSSLASCGSPTCPSRCM
jgi:Salmonella virulence plasmid 65kDa B protein